MGDTGGFGAGRAALGRADAPDGAEMVERLAREVSERAADLAGASRRYVAAFDAYEEAAREVARLSAIGRR